MDIVLTLVVNPGFSTELEKAKQIVSNAIGIALPETSILHEGRALDLLFQASSIQDIRSHVVAALAALPSIDWCIQENAPDRRKSMLIADMDSTMITVECIDELADFIGAKAKVSEITEAAMRGELDFEGALRERVALLEGLSVDMLETCYRERIKIMPGAAELVQTMSAAGAFSALVSGGFTYFTDRISKSIGFMANRANVLDIENGALTGKVVEPICGAAAKLEALHEYCAEHRIKSSQVLAVGDGANDIPMLQAAGLGVAYHAKPKTIEAAHAAVRHGDLTALLYFQGYQFDEFAPG